VLLHVSRWGTPGEFPLVVLVAIVNGRLATMTQSAFYPALAHSLTNTIIASTILAMRQ
jgi:hypothetical protein